MLLDAKDMSAGGNNMSAGGNNMFDDVDRDLLAEALPWIAGHCRFVTTNLPCGVVGVSIAAQLLAATPDACRRRVPDITGSGPDVFARAVDYGLLAEVPSARVIRSVPKLIADASPMFQRRGKRHWTLWIVQLLDAKMLAKIKKLTPPSQLRVCAPVTRSQPRSRGQLATVVQELTAALSAERSARELEAGRLSALERKLAEKSDALAGVLSEAADQAELLSQAKREIADLKRTQREDDDVRAELARLEGEVTRLRDAHDAAISEKDMLSTELAKAVEANEALAQRLRQLGHTDDILTLASGITRLFFGDKKK